MAVGVYEPRSKRPARQSFSLRSGSDFYYSPVLDGYSVIPVGSVRVEEQLRQECASHSESIGIWMPSLRAASRADS